MVQTLYLEGHQKLITGKTENLAPLTTSKLTQQISICIITQTDFAIIAMIHIKHAVSFQDDPCNYFGRKFLFLVLYLMWHQT